MDYKYNYLNNFLKEKFGERTLKICIDGGFTCPNRDGKVGTGGCIFCSEKGSGDQLKRIAIREQVENYLKSDRAKRANKYIAYFQNFTNTYAPVEVLKQRYSEALTDDRIVALAIATRPDEVDENVVELLKSYTDNYYVWVELGLQTSNEKTGRLINRCYTNDDFIRACNLLADNEIDVVVHMMVGLPGENFEDVKNTLEFINGQRVSGIKIHSTYVVQNTKLADMYDSGEYKPISYEEYMEELIWIIRHLRKDIVVHRFSGDPPKDILLAPKWATHKKWVMNRLNKELGNNE